MKWLRSFILASLVFIIFIFQPRALANMAAPAPSDVGTGISLQRNNDLVVENEILDIKFNELTANIMATYRMKNIRAYAVETKSMFLAPNASDINVLVNDFNVEFTKNIYYLGFESEIGRKDWEYVVLNPVEDKPIYDADTVAAIEFNMSFKPNEEYDIRVSYSYRLGGYPDYDFDVKYGRLEYYLLPAKMWNGFNGITINLTLNKDMPKLESSSLDFKNLGHNKYQYISDTLPNENLTIVVDQSNWQEFISSFNSPYLAMNFFMMLPIIILAFGVIIIVLVYVINRRKNKKKKSKIEAKNEKQE